MSNPSLTRALTALADQARPAVVAPDTWRRGRRRRRVRIAAAAVACAALVAGVPLLLDRDGGPQARPADPARPVVPATVYRPVTGEPTVIEEPPGPAALLVAGDQELRGSDIWGWEGRSLLVGQDGSYRLVRTVGESTAGAGGLMLSPDGRYLASIPWLEGSQWPEDGRDQAAVLDLTTGGTRQYDGGTPVAWSPDGSHLLTETSPRDGNGTVTGPASLGLLDLATGQTRRLLSIPGGTRVGNHVAFSPDGGRLAVATLAALYVVEVADGRSTKIATMTARDRLAGPGAWLPDGRGLALYTIDGCVDGQACAGADLANRLFRVRYVDPDRGWPTTGPLLAPARGLAVRLLGWQRTDAAVVAVYSPEKGARLDPNDANWSETDWWTVGGVELSAYGPDGSRHRLVDLPGSALFVDVPADLFDRFGGPSRPPVEGAARRVLALAWPVGQVVEAFAALVLLLVGLVVWRRRRRRRRSAAAAGGLVARR